MDAARARRAVPTAETIEGEAGEALASTQAS
jgi:hypothetical protein